MFDPDIAGQKDFALSLVRDACERLAACPESFEVRLSIERKLGWAMRRGQELGFADEIRTAIQTKLQLEGGEAG